MNTLITGATGFIGHELLRQLLVIDRDARFTALVRAPDDEELERRRRVLLSGLSPRAARRVDVVRGDMTLPDLGMSIRDNGAVQENVDRVIHCAASTRFDLPLDVAHRENVQSTAHVLSLCRALRARGRSGRLDHVSTAFVAGRREGIVGEEELDAGQAFRNTYERTKVEAEALCRDARAELPVVIHRPSIVVGRRSSGETSSYKAAYGPLRLLVDAYNTCPSLLNRIVPLPLPPEVRVDLVPVDYVAHAVATLWGRDDAVGRCYHLAAGLEGAATLRELVDVACQFFGTPRLRLLKPGVGLRFAGRLAAPVLRRTAPRIANIGGILFDYGLGMPRFDTSNAEAAGLCAPPVVQYFEAILRYAARTDFGRQANGARRERQTGHARADGSPASVAAGIR